MTSLLLRPAAVTLVALLFAGVAARTAGGDEYKIGDIAIIHPWSRATPKSAAVAAGYLTLVNNGTSPDRLVSATAEVAGRVEIHEMSMKDGIMSMHPLSEGVPLPTKGTVALKPGAIHLMLRDLKHPLSKGDTFAGTLTFEKAGTVPIVFFVDSIAATGDAPDNDPMGQ
jgi:copper(I)-binding protein